MSFCSALSGAGKQTRPAQGDKKRARQNRRPILWIVSACLAPHDSMADSQISAPCPALGQTFGIGVSPSQFYAMFDFPADASIQLLEWKTGLEGRLRSRSDFLRGMDAHGHFHDLWRDIDNQHFFAFGARYFPILNFFAPSDLCAAHGTAHNLLHLFLLLLGRFQT